MPHDRTHPQKIRHDGEGRKRLCGRRVLVRTGQHQQNAARRRAGHGTLRHRRGADKRHRPRGGSYALPGRGRPCPRRALCDLSDPVQSPIRSHLPGECQPPHPAGGGAAPAPAVLLWKPGPDRPDHHHHGGYGDAGKGILPLLPRHARRAHLHGADFRRHAALRLADGTGSFVGGARVAADGLSLPAHGKAAYKKGPRHSPRGHRRHAGGAGVRAGDQGVQPEGAVYRRPEPQAGRGGAGHHPGRAVHRLRGHGGTVLPKAGHRHHRPHGGAADEPRRPGADPVSDVPYRRHPGI